MPSTFLEEKRNEGMQDTSGVQRTEWRSMGPTAAILLRGGWPAGGCRRRGHQGCSDRDRWGTRGERRNAELLLFLLSALFPPPWPSTMSPQFSFPTSSLLQQCSFLEASLHLLMLGLCSCPSLYSCLSKYHQVSRPQRVALSWPLEMITLS